VSISARVIYGIAFVLGIATLVVNYCASRWLLIFIHERQIGHKNPFTFWAEDRALPIAFLAAVSVFWIVLLVVKREKHNRS